MAINAMKPITRHSLYKYYARPAVKVFPQFKLGAMIFFFGLVMIYGGSQLLQPSLAQEVVTLVGLMIIGGGFLLSMWSQIRMLIGRILRFFMETDDI